MSRIRTASMFALLGLLAAGCGIPLAELAAGPVNACESSGDCAAGGVCAPVGDSSACVATEADLQGLLLEIRPAASSSFGANVTYIVDVAGQGTALQDVAPDGQVRRFDPRLPPLVRVDGTLRLDAASPDCGATAPDGTFRATATFKPVLPFIGLNADDYTSTLESVTDGQNQLTGYRFHADVPAGMYDVYVVPEAPAGCADTLLPIALPRQSISGNTELNINAAAPVKLAGTLQVPDSSSMNGWSGIDGWSLEVVEPNHGSVISEVQTLVQISQVGPDYAVIDLDFDWTFDEGFSPLIRLRPPEGSALPTFHWDLSAAAISGPDSVNLSLLSDANTAPREVQWQVFDDSSDHVPVIASIQIQSAEISADLTSTGRYKLETETDETGGFAADLPPGKYRVVARPTADPTKAIGVQEIDIPPDLAMEGCFCGQSVTVPERSTLRGTVVGPAGEAMTSSYLVATPSLSGTSRYLDDVLTLAPLQPREQSMALLSTEFSLAVDPGEFDLSVRPPDGSNFPWLVRPRLSVPAADIAPSTDLDPMSVPYPAVLEGLITDPSGAALPGTVVRAWVPVKDPSDAGKVVGVIQIGETLAGPDGSYVLALPPTITP